MQLNLEAFAKGDGQKNNCYGWVLIHWDDLAFEGLLDLPHLSKHTNLYAFTVDVRGMGFYATFC